VPASGQTDIVSIQERSGSVRRPEPPDDPKAVEPTLARRERGGSAQRTRISGSRSVAGHRSGPRRTEPKPDSAGLVLSKACLFPTTEAGRTLTDFASQAMESNVSMFTSKNISEEPFSR
jgi:hypothetical protein